MSNLFAQLEKSRGLALLIAGGISATGFAPLNFWPLTLIALALLIHLLAKAESGKRAFLLGWLFGLGHFAIGNNWIATAFTYQAAMPAWLGWIAVILLALYLAVYPALACWGTWCIGKRVAPTLDQGFSPHGDSPQLSASLPFILAFAGCWIISEWLRSWVFTGFAWNPLAAVALPLSFTEPAIWLGTYGLSGIVAGFAGLLALFGRRGWPASIWALVLLCLVAAVGYLGDAADQLGVELSKKSLRPRTLTVVQPNISQIDKYAPGYDAINFARLAQHSRPLDARPRLLLWPEAAIPWRLEDGYPARAYQFQPGESADGARRVLMRLMNPGDVLLTGVDRLEFDKNRQLVGARNSVTAMDSSGKLLAHYDKAHLVPFGEYLALRWLLEPLGATRLVPGTIDFWPGLGPRTLDLPFDGKRVKVGMQICYEIVFSGQVTDRANRPDFIFNPSNDAWFGSWGPPQHLAQARLRAMEEGLPVVRATPTGISAVIDADGRIVQSLPLGTAGRIDAKLPMAKAPTLFARHGNILPLGFATLLISFALLPLVRRRFSR
jgi:apolipoprotein N-acyltransferase